jgi:hypothetical protein
MAPASIARRGFDQPRRSVSERRRDEFGNLFRYRSKINPDDPDVSHADRVAYDIFFVVESDPVTTENIPAKRAPSEAAHKCLVPGKQIARSSTGGS